MSFAYTPHVARKPLRPVKPSPSSSNHRRIPSGTPAKTPAKTPGRAAARTPALPTFREEDNDVAARLAQFEFRMVRTEMELDDLDRRKASIGPTPQASSARPAHAPALEPPLAAPEQLAAAEQLAAQLKEQLAASEQEAATLKPQLAAEQQAHATAQQLLNGQQRDAATTMQLAAAEQRLCATEQQLRAAKEELTAAKEQLAATRQRLHAEQGHVAELETSKASMNAALLLASEIMAEQRQTIAEVKGGLQIVARVHTPMVTPSDGEPPTPPEPKVEVEMLSTGGANITVSQASILRPGEARRGRQVPARLRVPPWLHAVLAVQGARAGRTSVNGHQHLHLRVRPDGLRQDLHHDGQGGGEDRGVVPRALEHLFDEVGLLAARGIRVTVELQILEIYGVKKGVELRDLGVNATSQKLADISDRGEMSNLSKSVIPNAESAIPLLEAASKRRVKASTKLNDESSRSHVLYRFNIIGASRKGQGQLNLVDLAGNERTKQSGVEGKEFDEAVEINKSLSTLTHCLMLGRQRDAKIANARLAGKKNEALAKAIEAIQERTGMPFRESKLTQLLRRSLSGEGKSIMLLCMRSDSGPESYTTMKFATGENGVVEKVSRA